MTGNRQALLASSSGAITFTVTLADTKAGANALADVTLNANGTVTVTGSGSSSSSARWHASPTPPTLYATYSVNSGSPPTVASGANAPTTGNPLYRWGTAAVGTVISTTTIKMCADAGGVSQVSTITINVTCTRTS